MQFNHIINQTYPNSALYIVATPIGNMGDITLRALHVLSIVDYIACEDTRHTNNLLNTYNIKANTIMCHEHNQNQASETILKYLAQGLRIAYVSDAGTPCISDPGSLLVENVIKNKFKVIPIAGVSTPTALMSVAGNLDINTHNISPAYCFAGFLPTTQVARLKYLNLLASYKMPIIFFESPKRINQTLLDLKQYFLNRKIVIGRELTKQFEQIIYTQIDDTMPEVNPKGEFCIIIGADKNNNEDTNTYLVTKLLEKLLPHLGSKQSSVIISEVLDMAQKPIYEQAVKIKNNILG